MLFLSKIKSIFAFPAHRMFAFLLIGVLLLFTIITPDHSYVSVANLNNMLTDSVIPAIFAFGMGIIIASSGFDLSLGHIASMVALIVAYLMSGGVRYDPVSAILVGLLAAAGAGVISGLLVSRMGISSFIVTLGMQFTIIGIRQIITHGQSVYISNEAFKWLATTQFGISNLVIILVLVSVLVYYLMEKSPFGRKIQFIGANIEASRFMGIDIRNITLATFVLGAVLAAFGGVLFAARAGAVQVNSVDSKLLDAITIAVFSSVIFGRFRSWGIVMAAILISMISTGMSMMEIKTEWIDFMKGLMLLASIFIAKFLNLSKGLSPIKHLTKGARIHGHEDTV